MPPIRPAGAVFVVTLVLVAACAATPEQPSARSAPPTSSSPGTPSATPTVSGAPSAAGTALVFEVTTEGGFINPAATIAAVPQLVVESDGSIYTPGVAAAAQPGMAPPVLVRNVGAAGVAAIKQAMKDVGLDKATSGGIAADTGTTVFTAVVDGSEVVSRFARGGGVGAGGPVGPGQPSQPAQPGGSNGANASGDPGAAAFDLVERIVDPTVAWGGNTGTQSTYQPIAWKVFAAPAPADATGTPGSSVEWPLGTTLADFGAPAAADFGVQGLRAGVVSGTDVAALAPLIAAPQGTIVKSGGANWMIWLRPLFPDELSS